MKNQTKQKALYNYDLYRKWFLTSSLVKVTTACNRYDSDDKKDMRAGSSNLGVNLVGNTELRMEEMVDIEAAFTCRSHNEWSVEPSYWGTFALTGTLGLVLRSVGVIGASCSTEGQPGGMLALGQCCPTAFATCAVLCGNEVKVLVMRFHCLLECRRHGCMLRLVGLHCLKLLTQCRDFVVKALLKLQDLLLGFTVRLGSFTVRQCALNLLKE